MHDPQQTIPFDRRAVPVDRFTLKDGLIVSLLMLLALILRVVNLSEPPRQYFDEVYYVDAAEKLWEGGLDPNSVHPPLGKWLIGAGMKATEAWGGEGANEALSWRLAAVVAGVLMVGATYGFASLLFGYNRVAATAAGFFVATEHLHLTMTRIAMLDPFLALFCLLGTWWSFAYFLGAHERWAVLGAFSLGLATGCKWSGLLTALGCFLACLFLDRYRHLDYQKSQRYFFWLLLLLPLGFFLTYAHLFVREGFGLETFQTIFGQGERMVRFRYDSEQFVHSYKSQFWQWPLVLRPIWLLFEEEAGLVQGICALGVATTWWIFTVLLIERFYTGLVRKRDLVGGALVLVWVGQWLPWAASTTGGFFYYMLPEVPIMACLMGKWLADLAASDDLLGEGRWKAWLLAAIYLGGCAAYLPFALGIWVKRGYFDALFFLPNWI